MDPIIGIDLGTTHSAVAYLTENGPEIIPNGIGGRLTPSVVGIDDDGQLLVGAAAKEYQVIKPERCAALFKRWMGNDHKVTLGKQSFTPEELSSLVLKSLKADAEAYFKQPVNRAVITVPAYFNDQQRKATIAAGRIAGLHVERILNEPTAAAIAYGFHGGKEDKTVLIFDLGGGTFDVSIVEQFEGSLEVRSSAGETSLGGEDFTRAIASKVLQTVGMPFERTEATMPLLVSRVIQQSEKAKRELSKNESAIVRVPDEKGDLEKGKEVTVDRAMLEACVMPILNRIDVPIRRVLADARLTRDKIHEVILVGGATRMPIVVNRVREIFNCDPHQKLNPDEVVALGAAVQAGLVQNNSAVDDLVVTDVSPFTMGVEVSKEFGDQIQDGFFDPVIDRNSVIPVSRVKSYATMTANQTVIRLRIYQGESRKVKENLLLGEFEVKGIPPGPRGQDVEVRFTYDLNGVLEVEATIVATKKVVSHVIARHAKGLNEAQIREAVANMAKLKLHPRDDAQNAYILKRAERCFQEISAELRRELIMYIDTFELALESREPERIENCRVALENFMNLFDPNPDGISGDSHE